MDINAYEDFYSEGKIALLNSIQKYDNSYNNDKSTFYYTCIKNHIIVNVIKKTLRHKRKSNLTSISLNKNYKQSNEELLDLITYKIDPYKEVQLKIYIDLKKDHKFLDGIDLKIINYLYMGYTYKEIAKLLNLKKATIEQRINHFRNVFACDKEIYNHSASKEVFISYNIRTMETKTYKSLYDLRREFPLLNMRAIRYRLNTNALIDNRFILFDSQSSFDKWRKS